MVPSDFSEETTCVPSCGRPKRGAAVRAEGVFKALALTGAVPEETSGIELTTFVDKAGVSAAEATTAEFEATTEVTAAAAVSSSEVLESPLNQSVSDCAMRPHFSVGKGSANAKQARRAKSRNHEQKRSEVMRRAASKPERKATSASIQRVLHNLAALSTGRMRTPANPVGMPDIWRAVDHCLQHLPDSTILNVDDILGYPTMRRSRPPAQAECTCEEVR